MVLRLRDGLRRGGGSAGWCDPCAYGDCSAGSVGGIGIGEPDAFFFVAWELGVAEEDAEVGEGEVGGAVAGAFAFPDAGGGAGEYVHGCVALSFFWLGM